MLNPVNLKPHQIIIVNESYVDFAEDIQVRYNLCGNRVEIIETVDKLAESYATDGNEPTYEIVTGVTKIRICGTKKHINISDEFDEKYWAFFTSHHPEHYELNK